MSDYRKIAELIASKLTDAELLELDELLDNDRDRDFTYCIREIAANRDVAVFGPDEKET